MSYTDLRDDLNGIRNDRDALQLQLTLQNERLKAVEREINNAIARGETPSTNLVNEKNDLMYTLIPGTLTALNSKEGDVTAFDGTNPGLFDELAPLLDTTFPILLFPVRMEVRFTSALPANPSLHTSGGSGGEGSPIMPKRLRVRLYPDAIAIHDHEQLLTEDEEKAGHKFWWQYLKRDQASDPLIEGNKIKAWENLCIAAKKSQRAAWVALQTKPIGFNMDDMSGTIPLIPDDYDSPNPTSPLPFPVITSYRTDSGTTQAYTRVMPDRFKLYGYDENDTLILTETGQKIPDTLRVGFDFNAQDNAKSISVDGNNNLVFEQRIKWMYDFAEAERMGMAFDIDITVDYNDPDSIWNKGIKKLFAVGVRPSFDENIGSSLVSDLFNDHHYTAGISLLKQGTATNNTDSKYAGYTQVDLDRELTQKIEVDEKLFEVVVDKKERTDGQILAEAIGLEYSDLYHVFNANGKDITNAMRMNNILWEATGGYYLRNMVYTNYMDLEIEKTKDFFTDYVRARGALPSIRVGKQPYGVLPATKFKTINWPAGYNNKNVLDNIHNITGKFDDIQLATARLAKTVGNTDNPEQTFADILGKHAVSQEYFIRKGLGPGYMWNYLMLIGDNNNAQIWLNEQQLSGNDFFSDLNLNQSNGIPDFLQYSFHSTTSKLGIPLVDDYPESDTEPLRVIPNTSKNYIGWLAQANLTQLRDLDFTEIGGGIEEDVPNTFLFKMCRQSLLLGYYNLACDLLNVPSEDRKEKEFVNFENEVYEAGGDENPYPDFRTRVGNSRWAIFDTYYEAGGMPIGDYIDSNFESITDDLPSYKYIVDVKIDLLAIEFLPTFDLGLLFRESLDLFIFRFDSWRLSLVNERINYMRGTLGDPSNRNKGLYVGAYGWLKNVKRKDIGLTLAHYDSLTGNPVYTRSDNNGFVLAPSITHAAAAAFLKSVYVTKANNAKPDFLSVNISSERMQKALEVLDAVRNSQRIDLVLGYHFEKKLYDLNIADHTYYFRDAFKTDSLVGSTNTNSVGIVVDGLKLIAAYKQHTTNIFTAIPALSSIPNLNTTEAYNAISYVANILDAIADLATAEGAYQIMLGNSEKAGKLSDALTAGTYPPEPDILKTPKNGILLTNSVMHTFTPFVTSNNGENLYTTTWGGIEPTWRAKTEPTINNWLISILPNAGDVSLKIAYVINNQPQEAHVFLNNLQLHPIDLVLDVDGMFNPESFVSKMIRKYVQENFTLNPDINVEIHFDLKNSSSSFSVNDLVPLLKQLKVFYLNSTPTKTSDFWTGVSNVENVEDRYDLDDIYNRVSALVETLNKQLTELTSWIELKNTALNLEMQNYAGGTNMVYNSADSSISTWSVLSPDSNYTTGRFVRNYGSGIGYGIADGQQLDFIFQVPCTIEVMFKCEQVSDDYQTILSSAFNYNDPSSNFKLCLTQDGRIAFVYGNTTYFDDIDVDLIDGNYHDLAIVIDQNNIKAVIDGIENDRTFFQLPSYTGQSGDMLVIGANPETGYGNNFNGSIWGIRFWNIPRSLGEIDSDKFQDLGSAPNLIASWHCNEAKDFWQYLFNKSVNEANETDLLNYSVFIKALDNEANSYLNLREIAIAKKLSHEARIIALEDFDYSLPSPSASKKEVNKFIKVASQLAEYILGGGYKMIPHFKLDQDIHVSLNRCLNNVESYERNLLLDHIPSTDTTDVFLKKRSLIMDKWFYGLSMVRKNILSYSLLQDVSALYSTDFGFDNWSLTPVQHPAVSTSDDRWLGISVNTTNENLNNRLSIVINANDYFKNNLNATSNHVALTIDSWTETIPLENTTAGLAFHYDQPQSKAPQCLLLAMHPVIGSEWAIETLRDIVVETYNLAEKRGEDYSSLSATVLAKTMGPFLPATENNTTIGFFNSELF